MANMPKKAPERGDEIQVVQVKRGRVTFCVLGTTPLICHRLSEKARRELLLPSPKKTAADKATTLKHDPYEEYRNSADVFSDESAQTLLCIPAVSFKAAMRGAAIDLPGSATKAAIGRLCYVEGDYVPIYGLPKLHMSVVRMADMARTPDIRTRLIVPQWASIVTVNFVTPILKEVAVANLLAGAGITQGVGDWRTEKGKGNYGSFELCEDADARFKALLKIGRKQQVAAMKDPECYDGETADLLTWFTGEAKRREFKVKEAG